MPLAPRPPKGKPNLTERHRTLPRSFERSPFGSTVAFAPNVGVSWPIPEPTSEKCVGVSDACRPSRLRRMIPRRSIRPTQRQQSASTWFRPRRQQGAQGFESLKPNNLRAFLFLWPSHLAHARRQHRLGHAIDDIDSGPSAPRGMCGIVVDACGDREIIPVVGGPGIACGVDG